MDIRKIYAPYLYAAIYDGDDCNIYRLMLKKLTDPEYLSDFFDKFYQRISDYIVEHIGIDRSETEEYAAEVNDQMIDIDEELDRICKELDAGNIENFGGCFTEHGKFDFRKLPEGGGNSKKYSIGYLPVKCKGTASPSLVRIYAIELSLSCYIIIYGGIKITLDTNESPDFNSKGEESILEAEISQRVKTVCDSLTQKGIVDSDGLIDFMEENK